MIPPDLDIEERQALASPRDYPADFRDPYGWQVCSECVKVFLGASRRIQCRTCAERKTL